jgi:quercetin dioxygenase-like cupin family protein
LAIASLRDDVAIHFVLKTVMRGQEKEDKAVAWKPNAATLARPYALQLQSVRLRSTPCCFDCFLMRFPNGGIYEKTHSGFVLCNADRYRACTGYYSGWTQESRLTGKDMDVIVTVVTVPPGENLPRHIHPGEEVVYVLDGATLLLPDGSERPFPTGAATINIRNVPHAGFKVAGDKALKMLTVHIVDKGRPVTEVVKWGTQRALELSALRGLGWR